MAEIRNKYFLNQVVWVRGWFYEPNPNIYKMRIVQISMRNGTIVYGCINHDCPVHSCMAEEATIFLTKEEAEHAGD